MKQLLITLIISSHSLAFSQEKKSHPLQKCFACHNGKTEAPFNWTESKESFRHKKLILSAIETGIMPPWQTDTSFTRFQNEIVLSEYEKKAIEKFLREEIPFPYSSSSMKDRRKTTKTISIAMNKPYLIHPHTEDIFTWFQSNYFFKDTTIISGITINSNNKKSLHHCEVYATNKSNFISTNFNKSKKGIIEIDTTFEDNKSTFKDNAHLIAGRFSGITAFNFPKSFSMAIYPKEGLLYYAHYSPLSVTDEDSTWIEISLCNENKTRPVQEYGIHAFQSLINPPFIIKENSIATFYCSKQTDDSMSVFSVYPHAHHLCQTILAYAVTPQMDTIPLVKIDKWQFHWQWHYNYEKLRVIPKGSTIFLQATYDNTTNNIDNPSNPPKETKLSFNSNDEMMSLFLYYTPYNKGDEDKPLDWRP